MNSSWPAMNLGKFNVAETNTKTGLTLAPNYYLNWLMRYHTYLLQENKDAEIEALISDIEEITNKDGNIYDVLVHYYWKKDRDKYQTYLTAARNYIENGTRGENNIEYYKITEGNLDEVLQTANQRFNDGRFNYNFSSNIFLTEFLSDEKVASLIKIIRAGKD